MPWVFEDGTYDRFFRDSGQTPPLTALANWEIRDLIYLILSFKEVIEGDPGHISYSRFEDELEKAKGKAKGLKDNAQALAVTRRVEFIEALCQHYSQPVDLGANHEKLPLFHPFMADLVGNTICADLLDYIVRDGKRLKLDTRDNPRLQRYLMIRPASSMVTETNRPSMRLTINAVHRNGLKRRDTVSDLLDLMRERYRFAEVVYYHPKKAAFSAMLAKAIELLAPTSRRVSELDSGSIYPAPWSQSGSAAHSARHVCHFGDDGLLTFLAEEALEVPSAAALIRGIQYRAEYRLAFTLDYDAAQDAGGHLKFIQKLRREGDADAGRKETERLLATVVPASSIGKSYAVPALIYCPNIKMQAKEVAAHAELTPDVVTPLNLQGDEPLVEEIRALNVKYQRLWRLYLFVHPELMFNKEDDPYTNELLSTIVDAFCTRFGVPERRRTQGSRFHYVGFEKRLNSHFQHWKLPFDHDPGLRTRILRVASSTAFWSEVGAMDFPAGFPVTDEHYTAGFTMAALMVAADDVEAQPRQGWSQYMKTFREKSWYRPSTIPAAEIARVAARNSFAGITDSLTGGQPASGRVKDWAGLVGAVALSLSTHKD